MSAVILIENNNSYLTNAPAWAINKIWSHLRFRDRGYFHNPMYKMKRWDGFIDFFNKTNGKFLTGLLPEIEAALTHLEVPYTKVDKTNGFDFKFNKIDEKFLLPWLPKGMDPFDLYDYQVQIVNQILAHKRGTVQAPTSAGKAQPLDSLVYTPTGPVRMGDLKIGDTVCTPDGKTASIIGLFPQGKKEIYKITFTNGDTVECCKEHLWLVDGISSGWVDKIFPTEKLFNTSCPSGRKKYAIKPAKMISFKSQKIKIDPYLLGLLVGDGRLGKNHIGISNADIEIIQYCKNIINPDYSWKQDSDIDYRLTKKTRKGNQKNIYLENLRYYGLADKLSNQKFIPNEYKYNSGKIRLSVLQGLLDSDGSIDKKGRIEFSSVSRKLAEDCKEIAESLGCICSFRSSIKKYRYKNQIKTGQKSYVVTIGNVKYWNLFRLTRKKIRRKLRQRQYRRVIEKIEFSGLKQCQCILIDSPQHLYVTNNCIPTHNTNILVSLVKSLPDNCPTLILANRKSLVEQNYHELKQWGVPNVGRLFDGANEPNIITCSTVQSVGKIEKLLPKMKALFVDEVHEMMSKSPKKVYNKLKECSVRVAISATPFKFDGTDKVQKFGVKGFFGPVMAPEGGVLTTAKLQERNILSKSKCIFFPVHEPDLQYMIYQDAVTHGIAKNWHFHQMVKRLVGTLSGRTLLLVERIEHGDILNEMLPGSLWVRGEDTLETRKEIIQQLKYSENDVVAIATHGIFNTGLNVFVHNLVNCASGQAEHMIIQRMGRGLRTAKDKDICNYYDFIFHVNEYLYKHSMKRVRILKKEGHDVEVKENFDL